jgi:lipoprotein-anchoring transpeptidase ErfK/SrfK
LIDPKNPLRIAAGALAAALVLGAGWAAYQYWPRTLSDVRTIATARSVSCGRRAIRCQADYVRLRQLVYFRTNQPVGTIMVDKSQTFLYVVRPNMSALRYNIGVGGQCAALRGLYHVVRKEELPEKQVRSAVCGYKLTRCPYSLPGQRFSYSWFQSSAAGRTLPEGCIQLINEDVIYLYDRTPLESRVVVSN